MSIYASKYFEEKANIQNIEEKYCYTEDEMLSIISHAAEAYGITESDIIDIIEDEDISLNEFCDMYLSEDKNTE